jgi:hypothetical protein
MKTVSLELFQLIKSLTKQEKRYFKLFATRHVIGEKNTYVQLFDAIDKQQEYDEAKLKQKFAGQVFIKQIHVTKNYLYKLILNSLRQYHENKSEDPFPVIIRNAQLLFKKGLIQQSEKALDKAMKKALENERFLQVLEVYRWKHHIIHNRNDLKGLEQYVNVDFQKEIDVLEIYRNYLEFQLLHDKIFIPYWKRGGIRKAEEKVAYSKLFEDELYHDLENAKSFNARMFYHNARFLYYFQIAEWEKCLEHMQAQVMMFEELEPAQRKGEREANYISSLINLYIIQKQLHKYHEGLLNLRKLRNIPTSSTALKSRLFTRSYNLEIDLYISTGQFRKGVSNLRSFVNELTDHEKQIQSQHRIGLYYNLAYLNFGAGKYDDSLDWVNRLLDEPDLKTREDLYSFGRILNLFIHYELGNDQLLEYIVKSTYRFLLKRKRLYKAESIVLKFLKKYPNFTDKQIMKGFREMHTELSSLTKNEFEARAFEYFDFLSWLESKLENLDFEEVSIEKKGTLNVVL